MNPKDDLVKMGCFTMSPIICLYIFYVVSVHIMYDHLNGIKSSQTASRISLKIMFNTLICIQVKSVRKQIFHDTSTHVGMCLCRKLFSIVNLDLKTSVVKVTMKLRAEHIYVFSQVQEAPGQPVLPHQTHSLILSVEIKY